MKEPELISKHFVLLCQGNIQEGRERRSNYRKVAEGINIERTNNSSPYLNATLREPYFA